MGAGPIQPPHAGIGPNKETQLTLFQASRWFGSPKCVIPVLQTPFPAGLPVFVSEFRQIALDAVTF